MANYIIATSSTSDLTRDWLDEHGVPFIPYTYTIGDDLYEDDCREESRAAVYAGMRKGDLLKTSMINEVVYCDFFRKLLETGKDVIFLDMSQKMSVSYKNALSAAEQVQAEFPKQTLYLMDTLCISGGLGMLVQNMVSRMEAGMSFDDVIEWEKATGNKALSGQMERDGVMSMIMSMSMNEFLDPKTGWHKIEYKGKEAWITGKSKYTEVIRG